MGRRKGTKRRKYVGQQEDDLKRQAASIRLQSTIAKQLERAQKELERLDRGGSDPRGLEGWERMMRGLGRR